MNAKWKRTIGLAAIALMLLACHAWTACAAQAAEASGSRSPTQSVVAKRLSRTAVDRLLSQAQKAIEEGNLDQAEALVQRAERSGIRYPLLYFGSTPAKVRFELTRAQRAAPARAKSPASSAATAGTASPLVPETSQGSSGEQTTDPFAVRQAALPAAPSSQPVPPSFSGQDAAGDLGTNSSGEPREFDLALGESVNNPFKSNADARDSPSLPPRQAAVQPRTNAAIRQPLSLTPVAPNDLAASLSSNGMLPTSDGSTHAAWTLPDAPLPAGTSTPLHPAQALSDPMVTPASTSTSVTATDAKHQALERLVKGRQALAAGDLVTAEKLLGEAHALGVSESQFLPSEDRPSLLAWEIRQARMRQPAGRAAEQLTAGGIDRYAQDERYGAASPGSGTTRLAQESDATRLAQHEEPGVTLMPPRTNLRVAQLPEEFKMPAYDTPPVEDEASPFADDPSPYAETIPYPTAEGEAAQLLDEGESALRRGDHERAQVLFEQAFDLRDELDPASQERLQEHLQMLSSEGTTPSDSSAASTPSLIESAASDQQVLARQLSAEVGKRQSEARRLREESPQKAIDALKEIRQKVVDSQLSEEFRAQLLRRIDFTLDETEKYFDDHRAEIELNEKNKAVLEEVDRSREVKVKVQQKVAELVDQFNKLRDEQRYAEMEVVARRLYEMAPNDPVAQQVWQNAKFIRRTIMNQQLADDREESYWATLNDVENSAVQDVGDGHEMKYDQKRWREFVKNRKGSDERNGRQTERELEIERRLKTPVLLRYEDTPLSEVVDGLAELAGVNIHLDPRGLSQEGVNSDTPVTINLSKEISLKSALNLVLEPLHLSYVIKDEVLKITSEQLRDGEIYSKVYNVADLVVPIPNFVPSSNMGLQALINDAHAAMGYGSGLGMPGPAVMLGEHAPQQGAASANDQLLAQQIGASTGGGIASASAPMGSGPGGMGGGANADFESLIDLIVSTVASDTWAENGGGEAEIREFETNLSLVISQTQAVHEQVADLLEQLRRLQDLQVTIEVRFIRLNDSFFERIGIDFDMNIEDRTFGNDADLVPGAPFEPRRPTVSVGIETPVAPTNPFPNFTADLDIPFRQGTFGVTRPTIGGGAASDFSTFGFAILSDIEAYFLIEAAQGDRRTNVLQAPKVTLFNGQQAIVTDVVQQPFVIGVIPVVSEFAAAQQPVIVVLNEGTLMSIQAVVSDDRRYVRLTVVPFFTGVGDVDTFTFEGSTSSTSSSSSTDDDEDGTDEASEGSSETVSSGVTVQLPEFQVVTVATTVSVPDGGTVLLGGIKRLSEGRNEAGVPLLSKVPYINRLFRNVGIGRETDSLMMMVTPRIIIQEEEEERLGIALGP